MKVVGFAGFSNSGKTTLVERLIPLMRSHGLRVSVVKHAHHRFDIDQPGKDTWRHRTAGAYEVVASSDLRMALMREYEQPAEPVVHDLIARLDAAVDWVFVEGFKESDLPKIEVWRSPSGAYPAQPLRFPHDPRIVAVAADVPGERLPVPPGALPVFDVDAPAVLADWLRAGGERWAYRGAGGAGMSVVPAAARPPLKPLDDALAELLAQAGPLEGTEEVDTFEADGRVLAVDAVSPLRVPPHDNSAMDGYAVRRADVAVAGASLATGLPVSQRIAAGSAPQPLEPGTAARIFTGAPLPPGADAVCMQEDCEALEGGARVRIQAVPQPDQWVRRAGEDIETGATVLAAGTRLTPAALGLAASIGLARLRVARRPRVALFSTGDELVMPGEVPPERMPPGAIYNSNRFFLRAMLLRLGCEVSDFGIVPDRRDVTQQALVDAAAAHDLVLTSGGVSVGEEDHVKPAVAALGRIDLWQVALKPGKPFAYGRIGERVHFMGLPGNPVSSLVTFAILVRPFLLRLQGVQDVSPRAVEAKANFHWPRADKRREFLRVRRDADGGLDLFPNQGSGVLTSAAWCDGLVDNPPGRTIARGDMVRFIPFSDLLA